MKILIVTNHSYMFYRFRKELLEALLLGITKSFSVRRLSVMRTICGKWARYA